MTSIRAHLSYKFRLYPNKTQEAVLMRLLAIGCQIWNQALLQRQWYHEHGEKLSWKTQFKLWRGYRNQHEFMQLIPCDTMGNLIIRLDKAYKAFFRRVKKSKEQAGFPQEKYHLESLEYRYGGGCKWVAEKPGVSRLYLMNVGNIRAHQHRPIPDGWVIKQIVVSREKDGSWYACLQMQGIHQTVYKQPITSVGIDIGLVYLLALSDGTTLDNPKWYRSGQQKRRVYARKSDRQRRANPLNAGNFNPDGTTKAGVFIWYKSTRERITLHLQRKHEAAISRRRRDFWHRVTDWLTRTYRQIALEDLSLDFLLSSPRLAMPARDAAFGLFYQLLKGKAIARGVELRFVPPQYTSQGCSKCGHVSADNRRTQASFVCQSCGHTENADINAAKNILARASFDSDMETGHEETA